MTDMEKYIKFLEAQLKTKNEKEKKSPQNKSNKDDNQAEKSEDTSTTKKFYSQLQSKPVREVKKENSTNDKELKKHPKEKTSPQSSSDDPFVKKSRVAHTPSTSKSSCEQNF